MQDLRIIIVDGGYSSIPVPRYCLWPAAVNWKDLRELQQEVHAALVLVCGAPPYTKKLEQKLLETFPEWTLSHTPNNCSSNLSLVDPVISSGVPQSAASGSSGVSSGVTQSAAPDIEELELSGQGRMAQVLKLRTNEGSAFSVLFTKQHHGAASTGYHFDADQRQMSLNAIFREVQQHTGPFIVCGGLGPTLSASCDTRWPAPVQRLSEDVKDPSQLSALVCGFRASKVEGALGASSGVLIIHCAADPAAEVAASKRSDPARKKHRVSESSSGERS